jgi:hypothetical protein
VGGEGWVEGWGEGCGSEKRGGGWVGRADGERGELEGWVG